MGQINICRHPYTRLGFAYQIGFVRLMNRFPIQHPFEIFDDLLTFVEVQLQIDRNLINKYLKRQPTISEHQARIMDYLNLKKFGPKQRELLQQWIFEEVCRLEQTTALFLQIEQFFIPTQQWQAMREEFFQQSGLPVRGGDAAKHLTERLSEAYDRCLSTFPDNTYARVDGDRWHSSVDSAEPTPLSEEIKLEKFKVWLKKHQRDIKLPQLLIEVDNELDFSGYFLPPAQNQSRPVDDICAIIAAIMAHGCNIGPDTMAKLTPSVTYPQIKRITDWQLTEETQRSALAVVVNAISDLSITQTWGEGKTSASDGQRFAFRRKVKWQNYSYKFRDYALEFYSFIADNYAPFYSVAFGDASRAD